MQAAVAFVEYLISGATALLWLHLLPWPKAAMGLGTERLALVAVVFLYVLGMMIDYVSARLVGPLKKVIKRRAASKPAPQYLRENYPDLYSSGAALMFLAKELGVEHRAFSSRDRMARGALLNLLIFTVVLTISDLSLGVAPKFVEAAVSFACTALMVGVWWQYESQSQDYKKEALATALQLEERKASKSSSK